MSRTMKRIELLNGSSQFRLYETKAKNVGELKEELTKRESTDFSHAVVNVNTTLAGDEIEIREGDQIAVVRTRKTGG